MPPYLLIKNGLHVLIYLFYHQYSDIIQLQILKMYQHVLLFHGNMVKLEWWCHDKNRFLYIFLYIIILLPLSTMGITVFCTYLIAVTSSFTASPAFLLCVCNLYCIDITFVIYFNLNYMIFFVVFLCKFW